MVTGIRFLVLRIFEEHLPDTALRNEHLSLTASRGRKAGLPAPPSGAKMHHSLRKQSSWRYDLGECVLGSVCGRVACITSLCWLSWRGQAGSRFTATMITQFDRQKSSRDGGDSQYSAP